MTRRPSTTVAWPVSRTTPSRRARVATTTPLVLGACVSSPSYDARKRLSPEDLDIVRSTSTVPSSPVTTSPAGRQDPSTRRSILTDACGNGSGPPLSPVTVSVVSRPA